MYNFNQIKRFSILGLALALMLSFPADAQKKSKKKKKGATEQAAKPEKKDKSIADLVKTSKKFEGLFTIYQDTTKGSIYMLINADQLEKEYIYFSQISDGVTEASSFRGAYRGSKIFKIKRYFNRIEFETQNTNFYFDPENALSKAADANVSNAILASEEIKAEEKGQILIEADNLFLKETFLQVKPPKWPGQSPTSFTLGNLDKDKTKVNAIRTYPENIDLAIEYVYSNSSVLNGGSNAVADGRSVSIKIHHSLLEVPKNDYTPRFDDPRVGYFNTQTENMTSTEAIAFRDMIHRWHLVKKDPEAELSEPVEPIVWWIENTTPVEFRETIKEGVLQWNKAFEKAGFKNAVVVKTQPDDADWDAGDIRYNVLRWTSSPNPPFGGYGPSFVNPRTGQILGSDIMLEFVFHTNRVRYDKLFNLDPASHYEEKPSWGEGHELYCSFGEMMQANTLFGQAVLIAEKNDGLAMEGMKKEAMMELLMHEVGHTLGLNHNMKSSQLFSPAQLSDPAFIQGKALTGSVMDYTAINVTRDRSKQGHYYTTTVGPYDEWAITFGYKPIAEEAELESILARSTEPQLMFGNDADDMRSPGKAIDPRVMIGDQSNDQITYSIDRMELVNDLMKDLKNKYTQDGESYQELRQAYYILMGQYNSATSIVSRFIGGVYIDRAMAGQEGATKPYAPVSLKEQKRAMQTLGKYLFAPDAFNAPNDLYNFLAMQRRGFNFFSGTEDPKIHAGILSMQNNTLKHLLHSNTLQRITDSELYGNEYKLGTYMTDLNDAVFAADINGNVNSFRQNLQIDYTKMLIEIISGKGKDRFSNHAQSMSIYNLNQIKRLASNRAGDISSQAHKAHLVRLIDNALEEVK
ncbi:MAG: zinc-dependent metalloprotease [Candidatus Cyclobacteriaceae bacterium M2_1C_046]